MLGTLNWSATDMVESIDWQAESLRVTAFPMNTSEVSAEAIWETCTGKEPDETRIQRDGTETREVGHGNGRLFLVKQIDRLDWRYHVQPEEGEDPPDYPVIGSLDSELNIIVELAKTWINSESMIPIKRLAFAAVLLLPVESAGNGYEVLRTLLPTVNHENIKDLNFQVNRPRESNAIDGISINRLARWSVARFRFLATNLQMISSEDEKSACRLEFDVNTSAQQTAAFAPSLLPDLVDELVGTGLELSQRGDVL